MNRQFEVEKILRELEELCPSGYALAFHIEYATPNYLFQTYRSAWIDRYSQKGYVMLDPTVRWGFENTGWVRWSALADQDEAGVLAEAAGHGLSYGVCYATETDGSRSVTSFARDDREFTDEEAGSICDRIEALHGLTADLVSLSPETAEELRKMSIRVTHPGSGKT